MRNRTATFFLVLLLPFVSTISVAQTPNNPVITLSRGMCEGDCPAYGVSIFEDGLIIYGGHLGENRSGMVRDSITADTVKALVEEAKRIEYEAFDPQYGRGGGDGQTTTTRVVLHGRIVEVIDYGYPSAPKVLREFQSHIDRVCKTERWTRR